MYHLPEADRYSYPIEWARRCRPSDGGFTRRSQEKQAATPANPRKTADQDR
ncbi:hypothetical protein Pd630_LPD10069 (plasmid) [Rhodococcus opacus PD630]|nr:hypothetical protein Pd630_LPD10069 [Rhodococcus opacus PD630]